MVIYHWDRRLELGVDFLDQQHRQVIECVNAFFIRRKCRKGKDSVSDCLKFLQQYILYHFQSEEAYQVASEYPGYRRHQALHKALSTQVMFFSVRLEACQYEESVIQEFYEFLVEWISDHVMKEDLDFAVHYQRYLAEQGVNPPLMPVPLQAPQRQEEGVQ